MLHGDRRRQGPRWSKNTEERGNFSVLDLSFLGLAGDAQLDGWAGWVEHRCPAAGFASERQHCGRAAGHWSAAEVPVDEVKDSGDGFGRRRRRRGGEMVERRLRAAVQCSSDFERLHSARVFVRRRCELGRRHGTGRISGSQSTYLGQLVPTTALPLASTQGQLSGLSGEV